MDHSANPNNMWKHIALAVTCNIFSYGLCVCGVHFAGPGLYGVAVGAALWAIIWAMVWLVARWAMRPRWRVMRSIWYYIFPILVFAWFAELWTGYKATAQTVRTMRKAHMDVDIIALLQNPRTIVQGLELTRSNLIQMPDHDLAVILDSVRMVCRRLTGDAYQSFRRILGMIPTLDSNRYLGTWQYFIGILRDLFVGGEDSPFEAVHRRDMLTTLLEAAVKVKGRLRPEVLSIFGAVFSPDRKDEDDVARTVLREFGDGRCGTDTLREVGKLATRKAVACPREFGSEFLGFLGQLRHKVFWLDGYELASAWATWGNDRSDGVLGGNRQLYGDLVKTVFSRLQEPEHEGISQGRVFRRLRGDLGVATIACRLQSGEGCTCTGESLCFKGIFSKQCKVLPGKPIPRLELTLSQGSGGPFALQGVVGDIHSDDEGRPVPGRGILFVDGEEEVVSGLYKVICERGGSP